MENILNKEFFSANRKRLFSLIKPNSVIVLFSADVFPRNGDQLSKFRQNSDTFYFSGLKQEHSIILLHCDENKTCKEIAFITEPDEKTLIWIGRKYSKSEASEISGIENIEFIKSFDSISAEFLKLAPTVYYSFASNNRTGYSENSDQIKWKAKLEKEFPQLLIENLDPISQSLRLIKSPEEIATIQKAIDITGKAFSNVLKNIKPNIHEYEVEAEITKSFLCAGAHDHAYLPIVATGKNACVLHYNTNRNICAQGDLLLLDFGAELDCYAADITRTIPVSGKFNARQKDVYNSVLKVFKQMKQKMIVGTTIRELNTECERLIEKELLKLGLLTNDDIAQQNPEHPALKKYFMHGLSHFIGLDVHDVGSRDTKLLPGMILSCEPGIYISEENIGIRLENDILIGENPIDLCENIPMEIDEIEKAMS
jgi:Xaa-Pro aminopeptidase